MVTARRTVRPDDLLLGCDAQQAEAITTTARPLCVLAGAGSGKTRVLTRRIAWRVIDGTALPAHVLTLTFTRKAASELRGRLASLGLPESVTAGTFHAIALAELRRLAAERREQPPVVLSSKARLVHAVMADRPSLMSGGRSTSGRGRAGRPSRASSAQALPIHDVAAEIEWAKSRLVTPVLYEAAARDAGREPPLPHRTIAELFEAYELERRRRRVLDFEDLLTVCAAEVLSDAEFAASARWRHRHLFVDEYQDVNTAQLALLKAWSGGDDDICVVGDPDQSIYSWNGSDPEAIGRFEQEFPGATVIELRTNYRSTGEVLAVAASVLGAAQAPRVGGPVPDGPIPTVTRYDSDADEAAGVAEKTRLAHRPGRRWSQIAVLARTNAQLAGFRSAFEERGVPCRVLGEGGYLRRPHVATALADLQQARDGAVLSSLASDLRSAAAASNESDAAEEAEQGGRQEDLTLEEGDDLADLAAMVDEYLTTDAVPTGPGFRAFVEANARALEAGDHRDAVELMTFHRAKGLEWPVVFVTGLEDGLVPIAHARDGAAVAEERRLLYVACTRAEEELHCSWARERRFSSERASQREPSPYLASIERARTQLSLLASRSPSTAREALASSRRVLGGSAHS